MKKTALLIWFCILFTGFISLSSRAQEAPAMPENFLVIEEFVAPFNMSAFTATQQRAVDLWKKYSFAIPLYTYRTVDNSFYWVVPVQNFGSLDDVFKQANEITQKMKEGGYDGDKEFRDLSTSRESVIHWSKDLSYHPSGEMGQSADKPFCEWIFVSLLSGHEKEAADVVKKYQAFYDSIDETDEWDVYAVMIGDDTPMWVLMFRDKDEVTMRQHEQELYSKYSDKFSELWQEFNKHVRKTRTQKGWFLPKWSLNVQE